MGLLKGIGGFASSYGPLLAAQGETKQKMAWMDAKASKLADATVQASQVEARRAATELVIKEVGDQITTIENSLKSDKDLFMDPAIRAAQSARLDKLITMKNELSRAHLVDVGWGDEWVIDVLFPGHSKKKDGDKDTGDEKVIAAVKTLTEKDEADIAKHEGEGTLQSLLPSGFWGKDAAKRRAAIAETVKNIAWKDDLLLNTIKGIPGIVAEDNFIRQIIADVLGNEPQIVNAQSEEDINAIVADPGLLKTIVGKIVEFVKDPLKRKEWGGKGPAPNEPDPDLNQRMLEQVGYDERIGLGQVASHPGQGGHVGGPDDPDLTIPQMEARAGVDPYNEIQDWHPMFRSPSSESYTSWAGTHPSIMGDSQPGTDRGLLSQATDATTELGQSSVEQPYRDYAPTTAEVPPPTGLPAEEGSLYPPAPMEPMSYNHVEGQKAGSVNITSMHIGDIAERYGYNTPIGLGFTYNQLVDIASKYIYPGSSKKEVREILDNINFTEKVQNIFMKHITEGR